MEPTEKPGLRWLNPKRASFALVYTAVLLTLMEYFLIPTRVQLMISEGARVATSLTAGVTWVAACVLGFLVIPLAIVLVCHRESPSSIGWSLRRFPRHLLVYLGLFALMVPAIFWASRQPGFLSAYPFIPKARTDLETFVLWELCYLLQFLALESYFRGYLLFTLEKSMGTLAIFVMTVPYTMIHFRKPFAECLGAVFAGIVLGALSLRFRSFVGGALLHGLVAVTMDLLSAHRAGLF